MHDTDRDRLAEIRAAADTVTDPCSIALGRPVGLAEMGVLRRIELGEGGRVTVALALTDPLCPFRARFEADIAKAVEAIDGVETCTVEFAGQLWSPEMDPRFRAFTVRATAHRTATHPTA
jgi:metal-sulfur cluster biosynthetic enzyme